MNKNAIKKFAIEARKKLIASVSDRAGMLGITAEGCSEPISKGIDFEVYKTVAGTEVTLGRSQCEQRRKLKEQIEARGFEAVVEEVAYTWFNRICAIRFMEVNDYLPTRVRVLSSEKEGKNEPDIVTQAPDVDLDFTDKEREYILDCKMNNKLDELFKMLFIKQCNKLSEILPELFEATEDYTEMLLNISYTNKDDIIHMLVNQETGIPEADFNVSTIGEDGQPTGQVEIIGWLYQYYNTELKDDTFAQLKKNVKISKERIPAATQLFTPDWIVRYMVENSVGRLWIEHLRAIDPTLNEKEVAERFGWKYYLPEAEQEADVNVKLAEIRTSYKDLKPEDITCIDPCMGSGHILVAMFDVLMDIYKSAGYSERDAAFEIVEHNIHGLDIDKRAYQLAYFAVMMKGRGYNRRFFKGRDNEELCPRLYVICDSKEINRNHLKYFGIGMEDEKKNTAIRKIEKLLDDFLQAELYGSILKLTEHYEWDLLNAFIDRMDEIEQISFEVYGIENTKKRIKRIIQIAMVLDKKYDAFITNPPYMGSNNMNAQLSDYVKKEYTNGKSDLFSSFILKGLVMTKKYGYSALVTMQSWMFLSSFEKMREEIFAMSQITNLLYMDNMVMGIAFGTSATIFKKSLDCAYRGTYNSVFYRNLKDNKPIQFPIQENRNATISQHVFKKIPGTPVAFWVTDALIKAFSQTLLSDIAYPKQGLATGDNERFLKLWFEVDYTNIEFSCVSHEESIKSQKKWYPCNKGGSYRKWFGNNYYVVNWKNDGMEMRGFKGSVIRNPQFYFRDGLTWSTMTNGDLSMRYSAIGNLFESKGSVCFFDDERKMKYAMGFLNSVVAKEILKILSPTMDYHEGPLGRLPIIIDERVMDEVVSLVNENIKIGIEDWNSRELSYAYCKPYFFGNTIEESWNKFLEMHINRCERLKENECRINEIFLVLYDMQKEMNSDIDENSLSLTKWNEKDFVKQVLSYAVGCMLGRFSIDKDGLSYAGGEYNVTNYITYSPNSDGIIPITEENYFDNDIIDMLNRWLVTMFGEEKLEDNLEYIARVIGNKGNSSREIIRTYFLTEYYSDHCDIYSVVGSGKRPIYWMFDSGKENGFKCLMYMHRYTSETVGKIRIDYLHKTQKAIEQAMHSAEYIRDNASNGTEKSSATKRIAKYAKQLAELKQYDEAMAHIANRRIELDLDDGVKVNYAKFQGVEVAQEGKKTLKIDLLAKI